MSNIYIPKQKKSFVNIQSVLGRDQEEYQRMYSTFCAIICSANDIANHYLLDAFREIKSAGMYRQMIKKSCDEAFVRYKIYEDEFLNKIIKRREGGERFYIDFFDNESWRIRKDGFSLYDNIKRVLDENKISNSKLKTFIILASEFLNLAVDIFTRIFDTCSPPPPSSMKLSFKKANLFSVLQAWRNVEMLLCRDCQSINLNNDSECSKIFDTIEAAIVSQNNLGESLDYATSNEILDNLNSDRLLLLDAKLKGCKYELTDRQVNYLRENYHLKTNKELAAFIGCGLTKLREFAKELGLTKKKVA